MEQKQTEKKRMNEREINLTSPVEGGEFVKIIVDKKTVCELWVSEYGKPDITFMGHNNFDEICIITENLNIKKGAAMKDNEAKDTFHWFDIKTKKGEGY